MINQKPYKLKISTNNYFNFATVYDLLKITDNLIQVVVLPKTRKRFVLIKSPHVNKKSKEHFQVITYRRLYHAKFSDKSLKDFLFKIPNDINIKIIKESTKFSYKSKRL